MTGECVQDRLQRLLAAPATRLLHRAAGAVETHLVGGALRDAVLGRSRRDLDAVVARDGRGTAERYAALAGATLVELGGERFAAYRLVGGEVTLDLWDRQGASLHSDLERRDLTVNSVALDLESGHVVDPFAGLRDLAARRLRATTPHSFDEDPLRVLRLARLAGSLDGFAIEPATLELARRAGGVLGGVAAERVRDEVELTFTAPRCRRALDVLIELELYPALWRGAPAPGDDASATRARASIAALDDLLAAPLDDLLAAPLDEALGAGRQATREIPVGAPPSSARSSGSTPGEPAPADAETPAAPTARTATVDRLATRLALLFEALEPSGSEAARLALARFRDRGFVTRRAAARAGKLLETRRLPGEEPPRRWFLHQAGELWPAAVLAAGARAAVAGESESWRSRAAALTRLAATAGEEIFSPAPLLDGRQIGDLLDLPPGPELGAAVAALARCQVEGGVRSRRGAADFLRRWRKETGRPGG